jgi:hypothetical protein
MFNLGKAHYYMEVLSVYATTRRPLRPDPSAYRSRILATGHSVTRCRPVQLRLSCYHPSSLYNRFRISVTVTC